jgi:hypothetical protein
MARVGKKVMQFLENERYVAVVVDGKIHMYATLSKAKQSPATLERSRFRFSLASSSIGQPTSSALRPGRSHSARTLPQLDFMARWVQF